MKKTKFSMSRTDKKLKKWKEPEDRARFRTETRYNKK